MSKNDNQFSPEQFFNPEAFKDLLKNAGPGSEALKEAADIAKALTECQTKYARESMEDMATFWRNWMSSGSNIKDKMEIQNQATRDCYEKAMAHNKEVAAILQKTQEKAMASFTEKATEAVKTAAKTKK